MMADVLFREADKGRFYTGHALAPIETITVRGKTLHIGDMVRVNISRKLDIVGKVLNIPSLDAVVLQVTDAHRELVYLNSIKILEVLG